VNGLPDRASPGLFPEDIEMTEPTNERGAAPAPATEPDQPAGPAKLDRNTLIIAAAIGAILVLLIAFNMN
jgi:hypothetical protein